MDDWQIVESGLLNDEWEYQIEKLVLPGCASAQPLQADGYRHRRVSIGPPAFQAVPRAEYRYLLMYSGPRTSGSTGWPGWTGWYERGGFKSPSSARSGACRHITNLTGQKVHLAGSTGPDALRRPDGSLPSGPPSRVRIMATAVGRALYASFKALSLLVLLVYSFFVVLERFTTPGTGSPLGDCLIFGLVVGGAAYSLSEIWLPVLGKQRKGQREAGHESNERTEKVCSGDLAPIAHAPHPDEDGQGQPDRPEQRPG